MEETSPCFVSAELSANPFHSEIAESSPHGESSETHVKEKLEMSDFVDGKGKSPGCELVSGFSGSDGISEGFTRNCDLGFVSELGSVKAEVQKTAENEKESSLFSDLVDKEERDSVKSEVGVTGIQEFEEFEEGLAVSRKLPAIQADSEKGLAVSSFSLHEKQFLGKAVESESNLEVKKKHLLKKLEALIMPGDKINAKEVFDSESSDNSTKIVGSDEKMSDRQEVHKPVKNGAEDLHVLKGIDGSARCSFEIEVIDETALIEPVFFPRTGYGSGKKIDFSIPGEHTKRQGNNLAKGMDEKKVKRSRRKAKAARKVQEMDGKNEVTQMAEAHNGRPKNGEGTKTQYNREELEALRFLNIVEQRKMWKDIYVGLGPAVSKEYDDLASSKHQNDLASSKHQKHMILNFESSKRYVKKEGLPSILGEACTENRDIELGNLIKTETEDLSASDAACCYNVVDEGGYPAQREYSEDDDSDENYVSIQRPAFLVEGEPNFESGPPEDGLEYLRRVRWEAAQVPKVRVAKLDRSKFNKDQTVYLPDIPEIAKCPEHLLPLKQWEDAFLSEFSELRLAMSHLESSTVEKSHSTMLPGGIKIKTKEVESYPRHDCSILENSYNQPSSLPGEENNTTQQPENLISKSSTDESSSNDPLLSVILGMDSVARVSMLRKWIKSLEDASTLSRNDCLWLFALCAVVDTPLDADSCASIRKLLRKCASLRAGKTVLDDEVIMLSILVTISGRYFGQAEAGSS